MDVDDTSKFMALGGKVTTTGGDRGLISLISLELR